MQRRRLAGLDGLRALAVVAVLLFHADAHLVPGGFLGVDLFFVISGYLITRLLLRELAETGKIDLAGFYLRRVIRLVPAVVVLIGFVSVGSLIWWRDELSSLPGSALSSLGYVANWWLIDSQQSYFVASGRPPMLQHLWSLAIEEQFYLIWPMVLLVVIGGPRWIKPRRFGRIAWLSIALALGSASLMAYIAGRDGVPYAADSSRIYFGTDTHGMGLLLGAAFGALAERLAYRPRRGWRIRNWPTDVLGGVALALLTGLVLRVDQFSNGLYRGGFLGVSALAVLVVATVSRRGSRLGRVLDIRPLRWLGDRSYSLYLWHWPVIIVTRPGVDLSANRWVIFAIRLVVPVALASLSYGLVESPLRRYGRRYLARRSARGPRVGRLAIALPRIAGGVALLVMFSSLVLSPRTVQAGPAIVPLAAAEDQSELPDPSPTLPVPSTSADPRPTASVTGSLHLASHPTPHASVTPVVTPGLTAFGDSVLLGASPALSQAVVPTSVHAVEGRQPYVTLAEVRTAAASGQLASNVLIHTGNNGIIRRGDLVATLNALKSRARVVLLTDRVPMDWQAPNNSLIKQVARSYPNVAVLDWYAASNGHQPWFYADGLHLKPAGATQYARLIKSLLG